MHHSIAGCLVTSEGKIVSLHHHSAAGTELSSCHPVKVSDRLTATTIRDRSPISVAFILRSLSDISDMWLPSDQCPDPEEDISPNYGCLVSVDVAPVRTVEGQALAQTGPHSQLLQESRRPEERNVQHSNYRGRS